MRPKNVPKPPSSCALAGKAAESKTAEAAAKTVHLRAAKPVIPKSPSHESKAPGLACGWRAILIVFVRTCVTHHT
jgi:hypothetical protein